MSTTSTLALEYEFQTGRTPRSAEVNANFSAISELINDEGLGTNNFKDETFTTAKFEAESVLISALPVLEKTKVADSLNIVFGSDQASFSSGTAGTVPVTGASVTITTQGNPVMFGLIPASTGLSRVVGGSGSLQGYFLERNSSRRAWIQGFGSGAIRSVSSLRVLDVPPSPGTYTYSLSVSSQFTEITLENYRVVAWEIA